MKVLMIGHGCNPLASSEPGLTWNWAAHMAERNIVHLITHTLHRREVEAFLTNHPCDGLRIHWLDVASPLDYWDPNRGERGIRFHYVLWLRKAMAYARKLHRTECFDLVHHVGWGTVSVPSPFWRLGLPLIWGPLGGGQTTPKNLLGLFGRSAWKERIRTLRVHSLPFIPAFRKAARRSAVILATNQESAEILKAGGALNVILQMDSALRREFVPNTTQERRSGSLLTVLWASRLVPFKGLDLAFSALRKLGSHAGIRLVVLGGGPLLEDARRRIIDLGLQDVLSLKGRVQWENMSSEFNASDVFLFTSVRESFGSVTLEAAAHGLPIIMLNLGGGKVFFPPGAALKIEPSTIEETVNAIAGALLYMRDHPAERQRMGWGAFEFAKSAVWPSHAAAMQTLYEDTLRKWRDTPIEPKVTHQDR